MAQILILVAPREGPDERRFRWFNRRVSALRLWSEHTMTKLKTHPQKARTSLGKHIFSDTELHRRGLEEPQWKLG